MASTARESARIVPVLDIKGGLAVRAVGGRRCEYAPIESPLLSSPEPLHFVERLVSAFGFDLFYVADIDAIQGNGANWAVIDEILEKSAASFMLDAGFRRADDILVLEGRSRLIPVVGTETFESWDWPGDLSKAAVSIDTYRGDLLSPKFGMTVGKVLSSAREAGARMFMHIRLDAVGLGLFDPRELVPPRAGEEWIAGGGVRSRGDLEALARIGYSSALVSSALHEGRLP
ncbi:MAG: HisA/HisF-related TIM barrel protein [Candidatus Nitrospinota bacterium M3_3B_026]